MSAAAQPAWKPPDADRQPSGWTPPESDRTAAAAPAELSPIEKAGKAFSEGLGLPQLLDIIRASNRYGTAQDVAARGVRAMNAIKGIGQGILNEPGRIKAELDQFTGASDPAQALYHAAGAVPFLGAGVQQVVQDIGRGDPAAAVGHTGALVAPFLAGPAADLAGQGIEATGRGLATAGALTRAAAEGAYEDAMAPSTVRVPILGTKVTAPSIVTSTLKGKAIGAGLGAGFGLTAPGAVTGAVVGAAVPIVRGAIRNVGEAIAARAADAAAAEEAMRAQAPAAPPPLALPPGPIITPPPADTSGVTAVPGQYATPEQGFTAPTSTPGTTTTPWPLPPKRPIPDDFLEGLAKNQGVTKKFARLTPDEQAPIRDLADRLVNPEHYPQAAAPRPPAAPPAPETAAAPEPPIDYEAIGRKAKAARLADIAEQVGITAQDAHDMIADDVERNNFAKGARETSVSPQTMGLIENELRKRAAAGAEMPAGSEEEPPARPPAGEMAPESLSQPLPQAEADFARAQSEAQAIRKDPFLQRVKQAGDEATQRLRDRGILNGGTQSANAFLDPTVIRDFSMSIAGDVARGALTFRQFTTRMLKQYGPEVRPFLGQIWHGSADLEGLMNKPLAVKAAGDAAPLTSDVGQALEAEVGRKLGQLNPAEDITLRRTRAIEQATSDLRYFLTQENNGQGWYTDAVKRTEDILTSELPELKDPAKMSLFKYLLATTSNGVSPVVNFGGAMKAWDLYKQTGGLHAYDPATGIGMTFRANSYVRAMDTLSKLIADKGEQGAVDWLQSEHPVSELNSYAGKGKVPGNATDSRLGSYVLGEKVGAFGANLNGIQTELTADKWWSRTWNRWMGTIMAKDGSGMPVLNKETGEAMLQDTPRNQTERALMRDVAAHVSGKLGINVSELQAILWYAEQKLYRAHGLDARSATYEDAAKTYFDRGKTVRPAGDAIDSGPLKKGRKNANP